ncbi:MAG: TetR/AcrR family transcriptional regulator [Pseudomonadota bacterium]
MTQDTHVEKQVGRPRGEYELRRIQIAEATWSVISERGFANASMRAIAREAGFTTGVLTHYFENKDEILEFALIHAFRGVEELLDQAMSEDNVIVVLRKMTLDNMPINSSNRRKWSAWQGYLTKSESNLQIAETIKRIHATNYSKLTKLLQRGQKDGTVRDDFSATDLAMQWNTMINGLIRMAPFEPDGLSIEQLTQVIDVHLAMIASAPPCDRQSTRKNRAH